MNDGNQYKEFAMPTKGVIYTAIKPQYNGLLLCENDIRFHFMLVRIIYRSYRGDIFCLIE